MDSVTEGTDLPSKSVTFSLFGGVKTKSFTNKFHSLRYAAK